MTDEPREEAAGGPRSGRRGKEPRHWEPRTRYELLAAGRRDIARAWLHDSPTGEGRCTTASFLEPPPPRKLPSRYATHPPLPSSPFPPIHANIFHRRRSTLTVARILRPCPQHARLFFLHLAIRPRPCLGEAATTSQPRVRSDSGPRLRLNADGGSVRPTPPCRRHGWLRTA